MRTPVSKAWPSIHEAIVEPKSTQNETVEYIPQLPVKDVVLKEVHSDILFTLQVKKEHILIASLFVLVLLLTARLSFVSGRLALLETSYTTRMK